MRRLLGALWLPILLVLAAGYGLLHLRRAITAPGPLTQPLIYAVPHEGVRPLSLDLTRAHIIANPRLFRWAAALTRAQGSLRAAEFAFPAGASVRQVLHILRTAKPVQHRLTVPEGLTAIQITTLLNGATAATGPVPHLAEGQFFPDTYIFVRGTTRAALVAQATARMQQILDEEWQNRVAGLPLATPTQALTLASIVERETALPGDRPLVAAVFLNRLRIGMKLESDPTVVYGASDGLGKLDRPISKQDLATATPFNTYVIPALPPTPIDSPGRAAIHAVLHPAASEDLYFVANGQGGGSSFASTLDAHKKNVENWRKTEK